MPREPTILHADMDAFYASIEQRDFPELRGKPVIVGGDGRRGVVSTCSYEARRFGVRSAMPGAQAKKLCPDGIFVPPRMEVYARESARIFEVFEQFTPEVEPLSLDEAFLDVTGSTALFGDGPTIARRIQDEVRARTRLGVSVGAAPSKFVAKVASDLRKPNGIVIVAPGTEAAFLADLPVSVLWGAGPVAQKRLAEAGIASVGDVQRLSERELAEHLGTRAAAHFHALARGVDPRRVESDRRARSISHETTFGVDLADDDALRDVLLRLSEGVGRRLRKNGLLGRTVKLKLRFPPFRTVSRQSTLDARTDDDMVIFRTGVELLASARRSGQPIRLIGIGVADLGGGDAGPVQGDLFAAEPSGDTTPSELLRAMDAIRDRFGEDAIRHGGAMRKRRDDREP